MEREKIEKLIAKWRSCKKELYLPNQYEYNGYATACGVHADELAQLLSELDAPAAPPTAGEDTP
jgi:hypothetical protein